MGDGPLSNPWEDEDRQGVLATPVLDTEAVEGAEELDASKRGRTTPSPGPQKLTPPRACLQEGPRCWAASLASWRNVRGYHPMPGDGAQPPVPIPFIPNGQLYLERFGAYARKEDGAFLPEYWWRLASENGMNWVEGHAGISGPVQFRVFAELLRTKGHLYVAKARQGAAWGHVVVVWAALPAVARSKGGGAQREDHVIFMDPQTGKVASGWSARAIDAMTDTYFWIAYAGDGTQDEFPVVQPG